MFIKNTLESFFDALGDSISDKLRNSSPPAQTQDEKKRCLLLAPWDLQQAAIRRIRSAQLPFIPVTTPPEDQERNFDCIIVTIDKRSQEAIDEVQKVAERLISASMHPSRVGLCILPAKGSVHSRSALFFHKLYPKKAWFIEYGDGMAAERALRSLLGET